MQAQTREDQRAAIVMNEEEKRRIQATAARMTKNEVDVWLCLGAAVFFAAIAFLLVFSADMHHEVNWIPLFGICSFAASFAYFSVKSWRTAERARNLLAQLRADAVRRATAEQPGVWPPPPNVPHK